MTLSTGKIFFLFLCIHLILSQEERTIKVYHSDTETLIGKIERRLINEVIDLHNKSEEIKFKLIYKEIPTFSQLISLIYSKKENEKDKFIAVGQITVNYERKEKYDFSIPYVPTKEVIIAAKKNNNGLSDNATIGFLINTIQAKSIQKFSKVRIKKIAFDDYTKMFKAILNNEIDYCLGDNIDVWNHESLHIVEELTNQQGEGFALLYLKDSELKKGLDPYITYYLKSTKFKFLIEKLYGKEVRDYFIKNLKL
jgi:hypothetical protein